MVDAHSQMKQKVN